VGFFNEGTIMQIVKIDGKDYDFDTLSKEAKGHYQGLQFVDSELGRLNAQIAVFKTARMAYAKGLNDALSNQLDPLAQQLAGDTIKLG